MKNNNEFDILNNANDETIEWLSTHNDALSGKDLKRMFAMSEKKYNKKKKYFFLSTDADDLEDADVTGVERYSRPKYYKTVFAASICLITAGAAITGAALIGKLNKNIVDPHKDPHQYASFETTTSCTDSTDLTTSKNTLINMTDVQTTVSENYTVSISSDNSEIKNEKVSTQSVVSEPQPTVTQVIPPVSSEIPVTDNNQADIKEYKTCAEQLLVALNYIEKIGESNVPFDMNDSFTDENGNTYAKVIQTQFTNTNELLSYMRSNITDELINKRYSGIVGSDSSRYVDFNGELYVKVAPTGSGFNWLDKEKKITDITDQSFTILAEFEWYGSSELMVINVVLDNGVWKINSFSSI